MKQWYDQISLPTRPPNRRETEESKLATFKMKTTSKTHLTVNGDFSMPCGVVNWLPPQVGLGRSNIYFNKHHTGAVWHPI